MFIVLSKFYILRDHIEIFVLKTRLGVILTCIIIFNILLLEALTISKTCLERSQITINLI